MNLETLNAIDSFVWGPPLLILLIGTGIMLTVRLKLLQVLRLPRALKLILRPRIRVKAISTALRRCAQP